MLATALFAGSFALIAITATMGFTRDESFYFRYSSVYQNWMWRVANEPADTPPLERALARRDTVGTWSQNFEHPPMMKALFGWSWRAFGDKERPVERLYREDDQALARVGRLEEADGFEVGDTVEILGPIAVGTRPEDAEVIGTGEVVERETNHAVLRLAGDLEALEATCEDPSDRAHPPSWIAGCRASSSGALQVMRESNAMRLPTWVFSALLIAVLYLFGTELFGPWAGLFAALSFLVVPRHFFHAHLCTFDMPVTTMIVLTVYAFWKSLRSRVWVLITSVLWGFGLLIKLNAFFIPIPLIAAWLLPPAIEWAERRWKAGDRPSAGAWIVVATGLLTTGVSMALLGKGVGLVVGLLWLAAARVRVRLPPMPLAFLTMPPIGLVMLFALWPRLWYDPAQAFYDYANFHLSHVHYLQQYFGHVLSAPPFPMSYPWVMTAMTVPAAILALIAIGLVTLYWAERRETSLYIRILLIANALFPIALISLPSTPIFGGVKHWMATLAFGSIIAGHGFDWLRRRGLHLLKAGLRPVATAALLALVLASGALASIRHVDHGTSYYNEVAGGMQGAADLRMQRQFWGYASLFALDWVNRNAPRGATVAFHNTTYDAFHWYQRDGLLRDDIRWRRNPPGRCRPGRDIYLFHHQESFAQDLIDAWHSLGTVTPEEVITRDGVPLLSIYRCPERAG